MTTKNLAADSLTPQERRALAWIARHQPTTYREIMAGIGWRSSGSAYEVVRRLKQYGLVIQGHGSTASPRGTYMPRFSRSFRPDQLYARPTRARSLRLAPDVVVSKGGKVYWIAQVMGGTGEDGIERSAAQALQALFPADAELRSGVRLG